MSEQKDSICINILAYWRAKRGLTMRELAEKSGLKPSTISRIESNEVKPYLSTLGKLAEALDIDLLELVSLAKNPKNLPVTAAKLTRVGATVSDREESLTVLYYHT
jgi:transcriptional regulator with XRE-family HTH domain